MATQSFLKKAKELEEAARRNHDDDSDHGNEVHDEGNWLISYADMMTLLCVFFVMLFSMSTISVPKYEKLREEVSKAMGNHYSAPSAETKFEVTQVLQELGVDKDVVIDSDPTGIVLVFHSTMFFDTLHAGLKNTGLNILEKLAFAVKQRQEILGKDYQIVVEGHTDSRPVGKSTFPSNWELSGARASRVVRLFVDQGFRPNQMLAIGYGDTRLREKDRDESGAWNEEAMARNRRVVIRILEPGVTVVPWAETAH